MWQVPYFLYFPTRTGRAPSGLVLPLALTLMWFLLATLLLAGRRRGGVVVVSVYLVTEAGFCLLHDLSGALGRDLPATGPILLIASCSAISMPSPRSAFLCGCAVTELKRARSPPPLGSPHCDCPRSSLRWR